MALNLSIGFSFIFSFGLFIGSFLLWKRIRSIACFIMMLGFFLVALARVITSVYTLRSAIGQPIQADPLFMVALQLSTYVSLIASLIAVGAFIVFALTAHEAEPAP